MSLLKVWQANSCREISFSPPALLSKLLQQNGLDASHPCGGRGHCGKCTVYAAGSLSSPSAAETRIGSRLSCQTVLLGDAEVRLPEELGAIETSGCAPAVGSPMAGSYGAAVDIGTTTIALKLYALASGTVLAEVGMMNPQRSISADVIGRIGAAMEGSLPLLQSLVTDAIQSLLVRSASLARISLEEIGALVVTGNTTMLYLLTGRDPSCLSAAPFRADCLFGQYETLLGIPVYYPACMSAFVGADITCAVLDSGMTLKQETSLLCDIGTNGEIALWTGGKLYVTSTAAGPAFEGAGISCGCSSIPGAIDRVKAEGGKLSVHTIGNRPAIGLCGSGLVDAVAAFLALGDIDETGAVEKDSLPLSDAVSLLPADIRAVQLAKGAIAAGIRTLTEMAKIPLEDIQTLYIAGGFGSHLDPASAAAIGLIPEDLESRVCVLGNAALSGAARLLLDQNRICFAEELAEKSEHITLSGNSRFNYHFMNAMLFGSEELTDEF